MSHGERPLRLEALWEDLDAGQIVERLQFDSKDGLEDWIRPTLYDGWGLPPDVVVERVVVSGVNALAFVRTDVSAFVMKWATADSEPSRSDVGFRAMRKLDAVGVSVALPVPTRSGADALQLVDRRVALHPFMEGTHLSVGDDEQVRTAGRVLARLHDALSDVEEPWPEGPVGERTDPEREAQSFLDSVRSESLCSAYSAAHRDTARLTAAALGEFHAIPEPQLVHFDFRSANLIWNDSLRTLTVLDFEEIRLAPRALDIARSAALLGTRFRDWVPTTAHQRAEFLAGYLEVDQLEDSELRSVQIYLCIELLRGAQAGWGREPWLQQARQAADAL